MITYCFWKNSIKGLKEDIVIKACNFIAAKQLTLLIINNQANKGKKEIKS